MARIPKKWPKIHNFPKVLAKSAAICLYKFAIFAKTWVPPWENRKNGQKIEKWPKIGQKDTFLGPFL